MKTHVDTGTTNSTHRGPGRMEPGTTVLTAVPRCHNMQTVGNQGLKTCNIRGGDDLNFESD